MSESDRSPSAYTPGEGDPVPRYRRNPRRAYDREGREIRPMDLANAAENGVRAVRAICPCGHVGEASITRFPPSTAVRDVGLRLRCSACGRKGPETEPVWPGQ
jgi:predicted RNA-binding Zn-ribbon protein involved in translation (DUF1610 family)